MAMWKVDPVACLGLARIVPGSKPLFRDMLTCEEGASSGLIGFVATVISLQTTLKNDHLRPLCHGYVDHAFPTGGMLRSRGVCALDC